MDRGGRVLANPDHVLSQARPRDRFGEVGIACGYGLQDPILHMPSIGTRKRALAALSETLGAAARAGSKQIGFPHHAVAAILCLVELLPLPHAEHGGEIVGMKTLHFFRVAQLQSAEWASGKWRRILAN